MALITRPSFGSADWSTFTPVEIPYIFFEFDLNTETVKITNCSQDNLLLTPEAIVGYVVAFPESDYQYVLERQELDQLHPIPVSILDFYSSLDLTTKMGCKNTFINMKVKEQLVIESTYPTIYVLTRLK